MFLRVELYAAARDAVGSDFVCVEYWNGTTVGEVRELLAEHSKKLAELLPRCRIAVDDEFADDETPVSIGATVAVLPPVSGG